MGSVELGPQQQRGFYGVMVSTQDSESCDPSSNLGRTFSIFLSVEHKFLWNQQFCFGVEGRGRDSSVGRALDWRSKGPRFDPGSRHFALGSFVFLLLTQLLQLCSVKKKNVRPTWGSNPRPWDWESHALPTELAGLVILCGGTFTFKSNNPLC